MPILAAMATQTDLLARVVAELERRNGSLRAVADAAGVKYDTVLRIKNGENDPGYSKVMALARYFGFVRVPQQQPAAPAQASA